MDKPIIDKKNFGFLIFVFIILLALALRLYMSRYMTVWFDEAIVLHHSQMSLNNLFGILEEIPHMPAYLILLKIWTFFLGISETSTRFLSILLGLGSVIMAYLIGKEYSGEKAGLFSSFLMAISSLSIYFSLKIRPYSLLILLVMLSFFSLYRYINHREKKYMLIYIISCVIMFYTHMLSLLIIACQLLYILYLIQFRNKKSLFGVLTITSVALVISLILWSPFMINQLKNIPGPGQIYPETKIFGTGRGSLFGSLIIFSGNYTLLSIFMGLLIIGVVKSKKEESTNLLLIWMFFPLLILFFFSYYIFQIFEIRYIAFCFPAFYILSGIGLSKLKKYISTMLIIIILLFSFSVLASQHSTLESQAPIFHDMWDDENELTFKEINETISKKERPIKGSTEYVLYPFSYYYSKDCFVSSDIISCLKSKNLEKENNIYWLITCPDKECDKSLFDNNNTITLIDSGENAALYELR